MHADEMRRLAAENPVHKVIAAQILERIEQIPSAGRLQWRCAPLYQERVKLLLNALGYEVRCSGPTGHHILRATITVTW